MAQAYFNFQVSDSLTVPLLVSRHFHHPSGHLLVNVEVGDQQPPQLDGFEPLQSLFHLKTHPRESVTPHMICQTFARELVLGRHPGIDNKLLSTEENNYLYMQMLINQEIVKEMLDFGRVLESRDHDGKCLFYFSKIMVKQFLQGNLIMQTPLLVGFILNISLC